MQILTVIFITSMISITALANPCVPSMADLSEHGIIPKEIIAELAQMSVTYEELSEANAVSEVYKKLLNQKLSELKAFLAETPEMSALKLSNIDNAGFEKELEKKALELLEPEIVRFRAQQSIERDGAKKDEVRQRDDEFNDLYVAEIKRLEVELANLEGQLDVATDEYEQDQRAVNSHSSAINALRKKHGIPSHVVVVTALGDPADDAKLTALNMQTNGLNFAERMSRMKVDELKNKISNTQSDYTIAQIRYANALMDRKRP